MSIEERKEEWSRHSPCSLHFPRFEVFALREALRGRPWLSAFSIVPTLPITGLSTQVSGHLAAEVVRRTGKTSNVLEWHTILRDSAVQVCYATIYTCDAAILSTTSAAANSRRSHALTPIHIP